MQQDRGGQGVVGEAKQGGHSSSTDSMLLVLAGQEDLALGFAWGGWPTACQGPT